MGVFSLVGVVLGVGCRGAVNWGVGCVGVAIWDVEGCGGNGIVGRRGEGMRL